MNILLFGITRDIVGERSIKLPLAQDETATVPKFVWELRQVLHVFYPELSKLSSLAIAVNNSYASDNDEIDSNDEIALIPPVSGG